MSLYECGMRSKLPDNPSPGCLPSNNSLRLSVELASSALKLCKLSSLAVNIDYNGFNYNNAD